MANVLYTIILGLRGAIVLLPWLAHLFIADILLSAFLPLSLLAPTHAYHLSSNIAASVWYGIQLILTRINGAHIIVSGAEQLPVGESAVVVSNHVDWADFYTIQELAIQKNMLGKCRYFAKQQLKWVPFLGWGLWALGMPLVSRNWASDQQELSRVFRGVVQQRWPIWLISFSEATRYTAQNRLRAEQWCTANNRQLARNLLFPRVKGFCASVQQLRKASHVKAVYDVTIAYARTPGRRHAGEEVVMAEEGFQSPPSFWQTVSRPRLRETWRIYVHVERFAMEELPGTDEGLGRWLEERWVVKGERLERLKERLVEKKEWEDSSEADSFVRVKSGGKKS